MWTYSCGTEILDDGDFATCIVGDCEHIINNYKSALYAPRRSISRSLRAFMYRGASRIRSAVSFMAEKRRSRTAAREKVKSGGESRGDLGADYDFLHSQAFGPYTEGKIRIKIKVLYAVGVNMA